MVLTDFDGCRVVVCCSLWMGVVDGGSFDGGELKFVTFLCFGG